MTRNSHDHGEEGDADSERDHDHRCDHCGRPFARRRPLALHLGLEHPEALSERERAAVDRAREREREELRRFRLKAIGGLVVLYFGLLFVYALFAT